MIADPLLHYFKIHR